MDAIHVPAGHFAPPKFARLATLSRAGVPVPPGVVLRPDRPDPGALERAYALLQRGPVVVRTALPCEDDLEGSFAGMGPHVGRVEARRHLDEVLADLAARSHADAALAYARALGRPPPGPLHVLVQRRVERRALWVLAVLDGGVVYAERHGSGPLPLALAATPTWSGPLDAGDPAPRGTLRLLARDVARLVASGPHGLEIEVCEDDVGRHFVVQARPLTAALAGDPAPFFAEVRRRGQAEHLAGLRLLDAEHNPAPLSPAHASLLDHLRARRPDAGDPVALAGWLYVRTLPRRLGRSQPGPAPSPNEVLARLRNEWLPDFEAKVHAVARRAAEPPPEPAVAAGLAVFDAMIDLYLDVIVPARRAAPAPPAEPTRAMAGRATHAASLPRVWDVASPALFAAPPRLEAPPPVPADPAVAALHLAEWDDHLFALGLRAVREVYLALCPRVGLSSSDVFFLRIEELAAAARGRPPAGPWLARRKADLDRARRLAPPLRIFDGVALPPPRRGRLRGIPTGPPVRGRLCVRADLGDLLDRPPPDPATAVVALPALLSQGSVVLAELGVCGVATEHGGALSHAVVVARELGLSALVGCRGCTELAEGTPVELDTRTGRMRVLPGDSLEGQSADASARPAAKR